VIVLKFSRAKLAGFLSGGAQGIVLGIFSTPFLTRVFLTAVFISRAVRGGQTGNQLDPQGGLGEIREAILEAIEASVVYPAILLNDLKAHSEFEVERDTVSDFLIGMNFHLRRLYPA
jgi:hypothetical protein